MSLKKIEIICTETKGPRPPAHGVNPRVALGLVSHFGMGGSTCIAPKIIETLKPSHDDNVGTQSTGSLPWSSLSLWACQA